MATNTSDFFTFSKTAGTAKNLQKPTDGGDNNLWGGYINVDLDTIVGAVNATSDLIADANQNELVDFTATTDAVNHVGITNAATGNGPTIEAKGDDSNVDLVVKPKGTGAILIRDGDGNEIVKTSRTASAVNEITVANAATGNGPTLSATGDDTNIDLNIAGKGTGEIEIASNIAFSNDTDAKVKLPSGGGIYESDGSTEILTESSGVASLKNTSINSNNTFPSGHIIKSGLLLYHNSASNILTNNPSFENTGLAGTLTTLKSSSDSRLEIYVKCGYALHEISNNGQVTLTLGSSSDTSYDADDDIINSSVTGERNFSSNVSGTGNQVFNPTYIFHYNTSQTSPNAYPVNLTSYSAGQTLYWRIMMKSGGSNRFFIYASNTFLTVHYYEIEK